MVEIKKHKMKDIESTIIDVQLDDIEVRLMNYGAMLLQIYTRDNKGDFEAVLIQYDQLESYVNNDPFFNATVAPYAGRISNARFTLNDTEYLLDQNHLDTECLHSGSETLAFQLFDYEVKEYEDHVDVIFTYHKKATESLFPGNQDVTITYKIYDTTVEMNYTVTTDQDTLVNITNHAYFNLSGDLKDTILNHKVKMNASRALELNDKFSPIGVYDCRGTHLDFTTMKKVKDNFYEGIYDRNEKGIDNPLLLDTVGLQYKQVDLIEEQSGRTLEIYTTYPCVVCYTHNHINDLDLLFGKKHVRHMGICFEMQYEPNGINVEGLHDSILRKEDTYNETIVFRFGIK